MSPKKDGKYKQKVTLGLSMHRPEMIPSMADAMRQHAAIFLEEPPAADFNQMLDGTLSVDDYLIQFDVEYPAFSRQMNYLLRDLKAEGKRIFQVEPFIEILLGIHDFFAEGHSPRELPKNSAQYPVYLAERNATGALLAYYDIAMTGSFDQILGAVQQFARLDAARFRLRDSLRVQALKPLIKKHTSAFIEAGVIHYPMWRLLRRHLSPPEYVELKFLADPALKMLGKNGHLYGAGDQLTLLYIFNPNLAKTKRERVLAARSIIFSKIIIKDEMTDNLETFPHLRNELDCIGITNRLSLDDCRCLFPLVRNAKSCDARGIVTEYLGELKSGST